MAQSKPTYLWVAEEILRKLERPLRAKDLVSYAQQDGLFSEEMYSSTPQKSMQARLSMDILNKGDNSLFVRMGPGLFYLRENLDGEGKRPSKKSDLELLDAGPIVPFHAPRRSPATPREHVLAIPENHVASILDFQGFSEDDGSMLRRLLDGAVQYLPRIDAEKTEKYKQVVTYVIVSHGTKVLSYRRGVFNRAADFLRGSRCIGFGGHVTLYDKSLFSASDYGISETAVRELAEEITLLERKALPDHSDLEIVGLINDDSTDEGRRHMGIVMRYEVNDWKHWRDARGGEASINQLQWIDITKEPINLIQFEYWSQICLRAMFPVVAIAQPQYRIIRKKLFQKPHILVVVGAIGSGKSWAAKYLSRHFAYKEINSGSVLASLLKVPPVPKTPREDFQAPAWEYISSPQGTENFAAALLEQVEKTKAEYVVIDGIRQLDTLTALRKKTHHSIALM